MEVAEQKSNTKCFPRRMVRCKASFLTKQISTKLKWAGLHIKPGACECNCTLLRSLLRSMRVRWDCYQWCGSHLSGCTHTPRYNPNVKFPDTVIFRTHPSISDTWILDKLPHNLGVRVEVSRRVERQILGDWKDGSVGKGIGLPSQTTWIWSPKASAVGETWLRQVILERPLLCYDIFIPTHIQMHKKLHCNKKADTDCVSVYLQVKLKTLCRSLYHVRDMKTNSLFFLLVTRPPWSPDWWVTTDKCAGTLSSKCPLWWS